MLVSIKVKQERLNKCKECPFKRDSFKIFNITLFKREPQCMSCGCMINKKASLKIASCPEGRWEK